MKCLRCGWDSPHPLDIAGLCVGCRHRNVLPQVKIDGCTCGAGSDEVSMRMLDEHDEAKLSGQIRKLFGRELRAGNLLAMFTCRVCGITSVKIPVKDAPKIEGA